MSVQKKDIAISHLILWDENARFPDKYYNSDEQELINFFFSDKKFEMKGFIKEIVDEFALPQLEKIVVWNNEGTNIVIEGNRRLTAYKVLQNPELIKEEKLRTFVKEIKAKIQIDENFKIECLVSENEGDCLKYVDRKHIRRNNEVSWQEPERINFSHRRGNSSSNNLITIGITKIVRELDLPSELIDKILGKGFVTTFFRVITTTPSKKKYKYEINEKGELIVNYPEFKNELKVIIYNILNKKDFEGKPIDSRTLNKSEHIETFINNVNPNDIKKVEEEIKNNTTENIFGELFTNIGDKSNNKNNQLPGRSKVKPIGLFLSSDVPFKTNSSSLRILYEELRDIDVAKFPNATHDLLRSFLECSLIFFFKDIGEYEFIAKTSQHNPKLGEMLAHIINNKCNLITDKNLIEAIKLVKSDYDQPYSLERMNMINHNENCASTERDVRKAWAQIEGLFKIILNTNMQFN